MERTWSATYPNGLPGPARAQLAVRGLGVAVLPALPPGTAESLSLRTLDITDPRPRARIALAWRADGPSGPAARALLDRLRKALVTPETDGYRGGGDPRAV
jgi:DNA-binding transcriptional LysR family regulator